MGNCFRFSKIKTACMSICQKRGLHLDPQLFLDKSPIPVVEVTKFLGVIFDMRLSFVPHLKFVKKKGLNSLNIKNIIGNTEWGADRKVMLRLYRSLLRSELDYGCIMYGSARKCYLQMLDPVHNQSLRLCLGTFRTSPVESLYVDAHEPSLGARRAKLYLQYASKIRERNVLFNDALNTFYLRLYGVRHMVKDHSDNEKGNPLPPHRLLLSINSKGSFICTSHRHDDTYHGLCYTSSGALAGTRNSSMGPPHEGSIRRPIAPWANALPLRYVPLLPRSSHCLNIPYMMRCLITTVLLTVSNIYFSDILETPSYFVLLPWCIGPPKIALDLVPSCLYRRITWWESCGLRYSLSIRHHHFKERDVALW